MAKKNAYELFSEAMKIVKAKTAHVAPAKRIMLAGFVMMHAVAHIVETLSREGSDEERRQLATDAKRAYREVIAPIDIPGIPEYMEVMIDNGVETAIGAATDFGLAYINDIHEEIDELLKEEAKS